MFYFVKQFAEIHKEHIFRWEKSNNRQLSDQVSQKKLVT